ncbi:hypothetical protein [Shewanella algae]|uniref:hypothetical protein n=1 Tax=Shewanella algae TaxID=38313 RepID=UPI001AAE6C34|nr:hypothetical protein [Shewanella algae]MBO2587858.1 hypothetical protein [Shewanella algae]
MKVLGINLETKSFRIAVLEGSKVNPSLIEKEKVVFNSLLSIADLMDWYETTFQEIINRVSPDRISIKLSLNGKKDQISRWYYPLGVLHKIAHEKNVPVNEFIQQNFTASKFDWPKKTDIYKHIDTVLGQHPPHWDKNQKYAVFAAWLALD